MHPVTLCIFLSWEESAVLVCLNLLPFVLVRMLECLVVGASRIPTVVFNRVQRDVVGVVICCCGGCRTPTEAFRDLVDEHGIMGVYSVSLRVPECSLYQTYTVYSELEV
eukprot:m.1055527 g.1055527  ORF g.1055527 m.1055527 type:complete len:109 (+) comp24192_c1_seq40:1772-2098(+)